MPPMGRQRPRGAGRKGRPAMAGRRRGTPSHPLPLHRSKVWRSCQPACKPGSVWRPKPRDDHSSGTSVAGRLARPTRTTAPERGGAFAPRRPYSVLLPVGFAMPFPLPGPRWALTPPFHPCRAARRPAVRFLWHFPWGRPRRALPGTVSPWSPVFPPRRPFGPCRSGRPAGWRPPAYRDWPAGQGRMHRRSAAPPTGMGRRHRPPRSVAGEDLLHL